MLKILWPLEELAALVMKEERSHPSPPTAHSLWDSHKLAFILPSI